MTATSNGMTFNTTGYTVTGGTLVFGGTITVATSVTGTIESKLTGAGVLNKSGPGVLRLTNTTNDFYRHADCRRRRARTDQNPQLVQSDRLPWRNAAVRRGDEHDDESCDPDRHCWGKHPGAATIDTEANAVTLSGSIGGAVNLTKTGTGTLTLSGSSGYTGATTGSAGRLSVNGALGNSSVAVLATATLGSSGVIGGPVSVANGGSLAPGNSIESLAIGTATFATGSTFAYEVDSTNPLSLGAAADLLVLGGDLNLDTGNGSIITVLDLATVPDPFYGGGGSGHRAAQPTHVVRSRREQVPSRARSPRNVPFHFPERWMEGPAVQTGGGSGWKNPD